MTQLKFFFILLLFTQHFTPALAQQTTFPYQKEIDEFKRQDQLNPPKEGAILFVGSSSIRGWNNLQDYFPGYNVINRGFGGSSLPDVIRFAPDIIYPYKPSQVVIYVGENDFTTTPFTTADSVFNRFTTLFNMIRKELPKTHILFVSLKPSPSRMKFKEGFEESNRLINNFIKKQPRAEFVDVYSKMLLADGSPMPDIFKQDKLHMNEKGYAIWQKAIKPYLKK